MGVKASREFESRPVRQLSGRGTAQLSHRTPMSIFTRGRDCQSALVRYPQRAEVWKIGQPISVRHADSSVVSWRPTT